MMSRINKLFFALAVLTVFGLATPTIKADDCGTTVGNLVVNCGFETGTFAGWTQSGNTGFTAVTPSAAHSGAFGASFGPVGSLGFIAQNIATVAGQTYNVSYWLQADAGTPNQFTASWDGMTFATLTNSPGFGYTQFTFSLVAVDASTTLMFGFRHDPAFFQFDDVVVTPAGAAIPEPMTMLLLGSGLAGLGMKLRRRKAN